MIRGAQTKTTWPMTRLLTSAQSFFIMAKDFDRLLLAHVGLGRRQVHCCLLVAGLRTIHVRHNMLLQDRDGVVYRTNTGLNEVVESLVAHEDDILRSGCAGVVVFRRGQRKQM